MNRTDNIATLMKNCDDKLEKKQMCLLLGRHRINYEVEDDPEEDEMNELIGNERLSEQFLKVAQDLDVLDPKTPEEQQQTTTLYTHKRNNSRSTAVQRPASDNNSNRHNDDNNNNVCYGC